MTSVARDARRGEVDEVLLARASWSRLAEPGDAVAGALVGALGPVDALRWLRETAAGDLVGPVATGVGPGTDGARRLVRSAERWASRLSGLDPARELDLLHRLGGRLLVPERAGWPSRMEDLGVGAPLCLWVLGPADVPSLLDRSVSIIGARACTAYGEHVTAEISAHVASQGWTVVSGGAYGVDAVAHRGALAAEGRTVAFVAGGVDRPYPAGNARLLAAIAAHGGGLVSEVPPGSVPTRTRFLLRNRLIAASSRATVVVEAAWRSGALNTAAHAAGLLRPVGAVPGPVTSAASAGCHRLLREGVAVCITDGAELLELAGSGAEVLDERRSLERPGDGLGAEARRALDALPLRRPADADSVARVAGLTLGELRAALGQLELAGLAEQEAGRWRRSGAARHGSGQNVTSRAPDKSGLAGIG